MELFFDLSQRGDQVMTDESTVYVAPLLPRFRTQTGVLLHYASGWHVKYYDRDPKDGEHKRMVAFLAWPDTDKFEAEKLMAEFIKKVNDRLKIGSRVPTPNELTVGQFWQKYHLPMLENPDSGKSWKTVRTYKHLWRMYLQPHFENRPIRTYSTHEANQWLSDLVTGKTTKTGKRLNESSYSLVRSLASSIFTHALNLPRIMMPGSPNPMSNVRLMVAIDEWVQGKPYSTEEIVKMWKAFRRDELGPKLWFAIGAMHGIRPSEIAGLKFEDINLKVGEMTIRRSCPNGHLQETVKARGAARTIALSELVVPIYKQWLKKCGNAATPQRFVFSRRDNQPVDDQDFDVRFLRPVAERAKVAWHGMKACRRTAATEVTELTKSIEAAAHITGDSRAMVDRHYAKKSKALGHRGQKLYDAAIKKGLR